MMFSQSMDAAPSICICSLLMILLGARKSEALLTMATSGGAQGASVTMATRWEEVGVTVTTLAAVAEMLYTPKMLEESGSGYELSSFGKKTKVSLLLLKAETSN